MTFEEAQAEAAAIMGEPVARPIEECEGWYFGERARVVEDDEDEGAYAGDEGFLIIEIVGSTKYGNERNAFSLIIDGSDSPVSVEADNLEGV